MSRIKITLSEVFKKHLRIVAFLAISGILGYALTLVANKPELVVIAAPVINYILYAIKTELDKEGIIEVIKER